MLFSTSPIGGMTMPSTRVVTILPNAAPTMTPTARSTTLPREMKSRNSFSMVSNLHLHSKFHHPLRRQTEVTGCALSVALHEDEELLTPERHTATLRGNDRLASKKIDHILRIHLESLRLSQQQRLGHIGILHE